MNITVISLLGQYAEIFKTYSNGVYIGRVMTGILVVGLVDS